jgi:hypothetical protein
MRLDLDLSLDTPIAWKRKPHAMVADLFGAKPELFDQFDRRGKGDAV